MGTDLDADVRDDLDRDGGEVAPPRVRRSAGLRSRRRRRRRRRTAVRTALTVAFIAALVPAVVVGVGELADDEVAPAPDAPGPAGDDGDPQPTALLATFDESDPTAGASMLALLAHDRDAGEATVLLIPTGTVTDVPGHGLLPVRRAAAFGGAPLAGATIDNLLGIATDQVVAVSEQGWASLVGRLGGLDLDVPERIVIEGDAGIETRFQPGAQFLDGPRVAELLTTPSVGESELERLPRVQLVLETLLARFHAEPATLDAVFADGAPMLVGADPDGLRTLFAEVAAAAADGRLITRTLPVTPLGAAEDATFRADTPRVESLVSEHLAASVPQGGVTAGRTLQILNGNGTPGIGSEVAQLLVPHGFRVVLTGNADRFDHAETRILVYGSDPDVVAAAEEIRRLLGVGRVERSPSPQSVVDLTIVVGADFGS